MSWSWSLLEEPRQRFIETYWSRAPIQVRSPKFEHQVPTDDPEQPAELLPLPGSRLKGCIEAGLLRWMIFVPPSFL